MAPSSSSRSHFPWVPSSWVVVVPTKQWDHAVAWKQEHPVAISFWTISSMAVLVLSLIAMNRCRRRIRNHYDQYHFVRRSAQAHKLLGDFQLTAKGGNYYSNDDDDDDDDNNYDHNNKSHDDDHCHNGPDKELGW